MRVSSNFKIRKSGDRGGADHGWLKAKHSFSFAEYQDTEYIQYRSMRVLNEDRIAGGQGFPMHPHKDMEIVTYILSGSLKHEDNMGNSAIIRPGDAQRMSAGTGVVHSEFNPSQEETHLFQIWFLPDKKGLPPGYEQKQIPEESKLNQLCLIASPTPDQYAVKIHQDAKIYACVLETNKNVRFDTSNERHLWIQLASGSLEIDGHKINAGDGLSISAAQSIKIKATTNSEFLLFDFN
ncbi:MAG: redox-sensitive bicupin YhaK (pirin superfamily) [Candidatus Omnitrophota bacterium]|jgi:redox-sensitive bicupin YhaK (pirin superfamily)